MSLGISFVIGCAILAYAYYRTHHPKKKDIEQFTQYSDKEIKEFMSRRKKKRSKK